MPPVRLLIADDHAIVRQGVRALLQEQRGWQVVAEASDGREAVVKAAELRPDLAILDIMMPSLNGLDATKQITELGMQTKVLILTVYDFDQLIHKALEAGARGYILKADAEPRFNSRRECTPGEQDVLYAKSGADGDRWIFGKRPEGKRGRMVAVNGKTKRNRRASVRGQKQQGRSGGVSSQCENSGDAPGEYSPETGMSFGHRASPLRYPQPSGGGLGALNGLHGL